MCDTCARKLYEEPKVQQTKNEKEKQHSHKYYTANNFQDLRNKILFSLSLKGLKMLRN